MTATAFWQIAASTESLLAWKLGPGNQLPGEHEEGGRGWQDKSGDGRRAHVVGWTEVSASIGYTQAGAAATNANNFSVPTAVACADQLGTRP